MPDAALHPPGPGADLRLAVHDAAPPAFASLCWDVFFASRGRGVSLHAHFPWLAAPRQACFVTLASGADVLAGCAIRFIADAAAQRRGGALGLVCVDPRHRGRGHATRVLGRAVGHAASLGLADLVLWTSQPCVYARHGFQPDDDAVFGTIAMPSRATAVAGQALERVDWPDAGDPRGLPPFAASGVRWRSPGASAIVLQGTDGPILAEWTGPDDDVAALLQQAMPASWRINALAADTLPQALAARGCTVDLAPTRLRMIRPLEDPGKPPRRYDLRVLDRV
jgi:GNAT superfamily N-acetyltransferase